MIRKKKRTAVPVPVRRRHPKLLGFRRRHVVTVSAALTALAIVGLLVVGYGFAYQPAPLMVPVPVENRQVVELRALLDDLDRLNKTVRDLSALNADLREELDFFKTAFIESAEATAAAAAKSR